MNPDIRREHMSDGIDPHCLDSALPQRAEIAAISVRNRTPVASNVPVCLNSLEHKALGARWKKQKSRKQTLSHDPDDHRPLQRTGGRLDAYRPLLKVP
jgi:hypothetical protein